MPNNRAPRLAGLAAGLIRTSGSSDTLNSGPRQAPIWYGSTSLAKVGTSSYTPNTPLRQFGEQGGWGGGGTGAHMRRARGGEEATLEGGAGFSGESALAGSRPARCCFGGNSQCVPRAVHAWLQAAGGHPVPAWVGTGRSCTTALRPGVKQPTAGSDAGAGRACCSRGSLSEDEEVIGRALALR